MPGRDADFSHAGPEPRLGPVVLVVEPDESVRRLLVEALTESGYRTLHAGCGGDALSQAASCERRIDALIVEVLLPDMRGAHLAETLLDNDGETAVVYTSGYTNMAAVRTRVLDGRSAFLDKPFTIAALQRALGDLLER